MCGAVWVGVSVCVGVCVCVNKFVNVFSSFNTHVVPLPDTKVSPFLNVMFVSFRCIFKHR